MIEKLEIISKNLSSQIPPYEEITLPKCPQTVAYIHVKDLEKEMRSQLNKSEDPLSMILKTLDIRMYSNCSKEFYEKVIKNSSCSIIPTKKLESFEMVTKHNIILTYCYSNFIKNNLEEINATVNTLSILI